ncbi:hypothetical protein FA13DRAFT_1866086 [Coprinellus micaceus]|uniref:chitin synthase n=1 Tax=Coprinellus micaceus TaxID=71717 RepID=A0A4Y7T5X4_COPMI|nr:hypothetical protein FA13DRAFT_1866086 [Coprinellus micaceus]
MTDHIYTGLSSNAIVVLNPHQCMQSDSDATCEQTGRDQCIVFMWGETLSGKSESRHLATKALLTLSTPALGKKNNKLASSIPATECILESFAHAQTLFNPNASRYGDYTELQFTAKGRICGVKDLEQGCVASVPSGERNFNVFYYLAASVSPEEGAHLHINEKSVFQYLGGQGLMGGGALPQRDEDSQKFDQLKVALEAIGFSERHVVQTCQVLAAILHLGNLKFIIDQHRNKDAAVVRNTDVLGIAVDFLGIAPSALESALSYKTKLFKKELCTVFLDALYSLLFNWINEHIHSKLCAKDDAGMFKTYVGLLNLAGPQNMSSRLNSLDQLVVNYANERVWGWIRDKMVGPEVLKEHASEGLESYVPALGWNDNTETLRLLRHYPGGLIHIMDDQARRQPKKTDDTMVEAFKTSSVIDTSTSPTAGGTTNVGMGASFTISHFNGPVTYLAEHFLARNLDSIDSDFVSLLRGTGLKECVQRLLERTSDTGGFLCPVINESVDEPGLLLLLHLDERPFVLLVLLNPVHPHPLNPAPPDGTLTPDVWHTHRPDALLDTDDGILAPSRCLEFESTTAEEALDEGVDAPLEGRSAQGQGQVKANRMMGGEIWEVRMTYAEFVGWYKDVVQGHFSDDDEKTFVIQTRDAMHLSPTDVVLRHTKVWLSQRVFHAFEDRLRVLEGETIGDASIGVDPRLVGFGDVRGIPGESDVGHGDGYGGAGGASSPGFGATHVGGSGGYSGNGGLGGGPVTPGYEGGLTPGGMMDNGSNQQLPLVANASAFPKSGAYDEEYGRSEEYYDGSRGAGPFRGGETDSISNFGSESAYALSRNMFQGVDKRGLAYGKDKEASALAGELAAGGADGGPPIVVETAEVLKEMSTRRRWVLFMWFLTWWVPNPILAWVGRMKHIDVRQAWREKLALNLIIWTICGAVVFVIAVLGVLICPTNHVFNRSELNSHNFNDNPTSTYVAIGGEVFDLSIIAERHGRTVPVVAKKAIMTYGGKEVDSMFPVQMAQMCYTSRKGSVGFTPKEVKELAKNGQSLVVYNGLIYDVTFCITTPPATATPEGTMAPPGTATQFLDEAVVDLFLTYAGTDITKLDSLPINCLVLGRQKISLRNLYTIGGVDNRNSAWCLLSTYILLVLPIIMVSIIGFKFFASINLDQSGHQRTTRSDSSLRKTIDKRKLLLIIYDGMIVGSGNDRPTPSIVLDILGADSNLDPEPLSFVSLGEGAKQHNMGKVYSGLYECAGHVVPYVAIAKVGKPTERSRPGNRGKRHSQMLLMHFLNKVHFNSPMNPLELEMYHQIKNVIVVNPSFYEYLFMVDADTTVNPFSVNRLISVMIRHKKLLGVCGEAELANAKQSLITIMQVYEYLIFHHMAKAFRSLFGSITCLPGCFTPYRLRTPDTHKPLLISNQPVHDYSENRVLLSQRRRWINSTVHNLGELIFLDQLCGFRCFSMCLIVMIDLLSTVTQPVTIAYKWDMIGWVLFYITTIPAFSLFLPLYSFWRMGDFLWDQTHVVLGESGKKLIVHDEGKLDPKAPVEAGATTETSFKLPPLCSPDPVSGGGLGRLTVLVDGLPVGSSGPRARFWQR